jgi:putative aminopeptidase FrvX
MRVESLEFFKAIVNTPSPSGYEYRAAEVYRRYTREFADEVTTDVMGNVIAALNPSGKPRVMFAGHMDEIGFIVRYISEEGFLYFGPIGGHDAVIPVGQRVYVHTASRRHSGRDWTQTYSSSGRGRAQQGAQAARSVGRYWRRQ